jgi:hypothetical protein
MELGMGINLEIKQLKNNKVVIMDNKIDNELNNRQMWFQ